MIGFIASNSIIAFVLFVMVFGSLLGIVYREDYRRLKTERSSEREEIPVGKWYHKQTLSTWLEWRQWTLNRYYHKLKGILLVRVISTYSYFFKGTVAVGLALFAYDLADKSAVVAGATVFYASMLFLESRFTYAALWPTNIDKHRGKKEGIMDSACCNIDIRNIGESNARNIQTDIRIIDPVRNVNTGLLDGDISIDDEESLSTSIEASLSREFKYCITTDAQSNNSGFYRTKMNDRLGVTPWAIIDFQTPDALIMTRVYVPIHESERISLNDIAEGTKSMVEAVSAKKERLGITPGTSIETADDESEEDGENEEEIQNDGGGSGEDDRES